MTAADRLTTARLVLIAPCAGLLGLGCALESDALLVAGAAVYTVAGLTDAIDGPLARRRNCESRFGRLMDPIGDKALVTACLGALWAFGKAPTVPFAIIAAREAVSVGLWSLSAYLGAPLSPNIGGKTKMVLQSVAIVSLAIEASVGPTGFGAVAVWAAAALTAVTGVLQIVRSRRLWRKAWERVSTSAEGAGP